MQYHLTNGIIERGFEVSEHGVRTVSLKDLRYGSEYIHDPVREYAFAIDDVLYSSYGESRVREVDGNREEVHLLPVLTDARQEPDSLEEARLTYPFAPENRHPRHGFLERPLS